MSVDTNEQLDSQHKNRHVASAFAIFLGGFGAHEFYLGNTKQGATSLLFFWTVIPFYIGIDTGIHYLTMSDKEFHRHVAGEPTPSAGDTELDTEIQRGSLTRKEKWNEVRNTTLPDLLGESKTYRYVAGSALLYVVIFTTLSYLLYGSLGGMLTALSSIGSPQYVVEPIVLNAIIAAIVSVFSIRVVATADLLPVSMDDIPRMVVGSSAAVFFWGSLFVISTFVVLIPVYGVVSIPTGVRPAVSGILGLGLATVWLVGRIHHTFPSGFYIRRHNAQRSIRIATSLLATAEDQIRNGAFDQAKDAVVEAHETLTKVDERLATGAVVGSGIAATVDSVNDHCAQLAEQLAAEGIELDVIPTDVDESTIDEDPAVEDPDVEDSAVDDSETDIEQTPDTGRAEKPTATADTVDSSQPEQIEVETPDESTVAARDQPSPTATQPESTATTEATETQPESTATTEATKAQSESTATSDATETAEAQPESTATETQPESTATTEATEAQPESTATTDATETQPESTATTDATETQPESTATTDSTEVSTETSNVDVETPDTSQRDHTATVVASDAEDGEKQSAGAVTEQAAQTVVPREPPLSVSDVRTVRKRISANKETRFRSDIDRYKESIAIAVDIETADITIPILENCSLYATAVAYERIAETLDTVHRLQGTYPEFEWETFKTEFTRIITGEKRVSRATLSMYHSVIANADTVLTYLRIVPNTHPSIEAEEWYNAVSTALTEQDPLVLDPLVGTVNRSGSEQWKRTQLYAVTRQELGALVGELYRSFGYTVEVTHGTTDVGIDVWAELHEQWTAIEVKQRSKDDLVGRKTVQTLANKMSSGKADKTVVVTSSGFTEAAEAYAAETWNIKLIDGEELLVLLRDSEIPPVV